MTVTIALIALNALISWQAFSNHAMLDKLKHYPYIESHRHEWVRMLTGTFVHGDIAHLLFNMYALYGFGTQVEYTYMDVFGNVQGRIFYLLMYLLSGCLANLMTYFANKENPSFASVGASGAVSAVMFAFVIFYPWQKFLLFYIIPIPGIIATVLYLIYSSYAARQGKGIIDHRAHFWGAVFGFLITIILKPSLFGYFINEVLHK